MNVLISGATGLIGSALDRSLASHGHTVTRLTRRPQEARDRRWDPVAGEIDPHALDGIDAVIHLAGESIGSARWSQEQRRRIIDSRVSGTRLLRQEIERRPSGSERPTAFVCASAIGYYGDRGDDLLDETSPPGDGFLSQVCTAWEAEVRTDATRWAIVRTGIVLSPDGGALDRMLTPAKFGLGGPIGRGRQWWSWITLDDLVGVYGHLALTAQVGGVVNGTTPNPVRQRDFAKALGRVLRRPSFLPLPKAAVKLMLGEMGEHLLFDSAHVQPVQLLSGGFAWRHTELEPALREIL